MGEKVGAVVFGVNEYLFHGDVLFCANSFVSVVSAKPVEKKNISVNLLNHLHLT